MGLKIVFGRAGTGKSEYCYNEISNKIKEKNKILLITPEQFSFTAEKVNGFYKNRCSNKCRSCYF